MIPVEDIKKQVRDYYGGLAVQTGKCCGGSSCCVPQQVSDAQARTEQNVDFLAPLLSCGSPLAFAQLQAGETVVDLGSGVGREVLSAAVAVGATGRSIGVDMTWEMISKARTNASRAGVANAEFRLGEIEHIPLLDASADVVISNCVINLVPDKTRAFREAYRVLRPAGRLVVSDVVSYGPLPEEVRTNPAAWTACVAGAIDLSAYLATIEEAGFQEIEILEAASAAPGLVHCVTVRARKVAQ